MDFAKLSKSERLQFIQLAQSQLNADPIKSNDTVYQARILFNQLVEYPNAQYTAPVIDLYLAEHLQNMGNNQVYTVDQINNLTPGQIDQFVKVLGIQLDSGESESEHLEEFNFQDLKQRIKQILYYLGLIQLDILSGEPQINIELTNKQTPNSPLSIDQPLTFNYQGHKFQVDNYLTKGRESLIYEGYYDGVPVIYSVGKQVTIPPEIKPYFPQVYLTFRDVNQKLVNVIEKLYFPKWSDKFYQGALEFLNQLKTHRLKHGDISLNNIMMNTQGEFRAIDYSPGSRGSPGYPMNDEQALGHVLFEVKNEDVLREYNALFHQTIQQLRNKLPEIPPELIVEDAEQQDGYEPSDYYQWVEAQDYLTKLSFKNTLRPDYRPKLMDIINLYRVILKLEAALAYLEHTYIDIKQLIEVDPVAEQFGKWIDMESREYRPKFYEWLRSQPLDDIDRGLLEMMRV